MATPTITSVVPARGHSGGRTLVEVSGTNFRIDPAPPATGPTEAYPSPPMRVLFGGADATAVAVVSDTLLYCLTPEQDPVDLPDGTYGTVDVEVRNVDSTTGATLPGETATLADAFSFVRPDLTQPGELSRVIRAFLRKLKRQVHRNVSFVVHTDYDAATGDLLNTALVQSLPALVVANLDLPENRAHASNTDVEVLVDAERFVARRPPVVVDAVMQLVGASDDSVELLNLIEATRLFFQKNPTLAVDRVEGDPSKGVASYDMHFSFGTPVSTSRQEDNSSVQSFAGEVRIEGVLLEDVPGLPTEKPAGIPAHLAHEATHEFGYRATEGAAADQQDVE